MLGHFAGKRPTLRHSDMSSWPVGREKCDPLPGPGVRGGGRNLPNSDPETGILWLGLRFVRGGPTAGRALDLDWRWFEWGFAEILIDDVALAVEGFDQAETG